MTTRPLHPHPQIDALLAKMDNVISDHALTALHDAARTTVYNDVEWVNDIPVRTDIDA